MRIRFETETRGNSEVAYVLFHGKSWLTVSHNKQSCTKDFDPIVLLFCQVKAFVQVRPSLVYQLHIRLQ